MSYICSFCLFFIIPWRSGALGHAIGHACGVRVQKVQRVQRVQRGGLTALRAEGCGRLSAAGCVRFAQGATVPTALKVTVSPSRAMSFISRLRRSRQHRVSILSAYLVHPFPLRGTSPQGETRALRDLLSVSYDIVSILVISRYAAPPYPAAPDFPPKGETTHYDLCVAGAPSNHVRCASTGKRVTRFSGRFAPLRIVFP